MGDEWQDYKPQASGDGWQDYESSGVRSAASPIAPPVLAKPSVDMKPVYLMGGSSQNPDEVDRKPGVDPTMESLGKIGAGALEGMAHTAASPVATVHRLLQRHGVAPQGDIYPGEHTSEQIEKQDVPNAVMMMAGGPEAEEATAGVSRARAIPEAAVSRTAEAPGMAMRVGKVIARKIPGVGLASDLIDAVRGPEPPAPPTPKPFRIPEYGTPQELRGRVIPQQADALGNLRQTGAQSAAVTGEALAAKPIAEITEKPVAPSGGGASAPKRVPIKIVRQSTALGPNARVMTQASALGKPPIPEPVWPENYQTGGQSAAGGGANYSAADLAAFKARNNIMPISSDMVGEPPSIPGKNMVPYEQRASTIIPKEQAEAFARRFEGRGATKEEIGAGEERRANPQRGNVEATPEERAALKNRIKQANPDWSDQELNTETQRILNKEAYNRARGGDPREAAAPRGRAIPETAPTSLVKPRFSENPRYNYQAKVQGAENIPTPYAWERGARTLADIADERALQQEMRANFDRDEQIVQAQAARDYAARNSMDTPKSELIRQATVAKPIPEENLAPTWERALEDFRRKQAAKSGKPKE